MPDQIDKDDFPLIQLDEEDRRERQPKQKSSSTTSSASPISSPTQNDPGTKSGSGLAVFALLIAFAACGGAGWLYMQLEQQIAVSDRAERRIAELENKLSATGEEIGESTVALQVKVTELSNKTNELWEQMDKLWASAWRRNQKDIEDLSKKVDDNVGSLKSRMSSVTSTASDNTQTIADTKVQVENLASEALALSVQLERSSATDASTRRDLQAASEKLALLEQRNAALVNRLNQLENEIRDLATRAATSSVTPQ